MSVAPAFDNEIRLTAESRRMVTIAARMFRISHTLTVRSSEPETSFSSFVKAALVMLLKQIKVVDV